MKNIEDIRNIFVQKYEDEDFIVDKSGCGMLEVLGTSFIADEETIFGKVNKVYIQKELDWYLSQSRNVYDIPGTPAIWKQVATKDGMINSNYGFLLFSKENAEQYLHAFQALVADKNTRRACMIYTRPSIQTEYCHDGMSDFICTNAVSYFIRNNKIHCTVQMRSNDIWAGYRNDYAWQRWVLNNLHKDLLREYEDLELGDIIWNASSLHMYERNFGLIRKYKKLGLYK
jgi:thymidylate synthase|tara:strand:- start:8868 stop:9554 length:687 start_codon:yes stop_codon:yes gene_type:complete